MKYSALAHLGATFQEGSRFQAVKTFRLGAGWGLYFVFYPKPADLFFALNKQGDAGAFESPRPQSPVASHPLQLYLRAHFLNLRLARVKQVSSVELCFDFLPTPCRMVLRLKGSELEAHLSVPDRKDFQTRLPLGTWDFEGNDALNKEPAEILPSSFTPLKQSPQEKEAQRAQKKIQRRLAKVDEDIQEGKDWLLKFGDLCDQLKNDPLAWSKGAFGPELLKIIQAEVDEGRLPRMSSGTLGRAQEILFKARRRAQRKVTGGEKRHADLLSSKTSKISKKRTEGQKEHLQLESERTTGRFQVPKKKPGQWVLLLEGLWARIGRSASENSELFRQAKDRDLWFHVRGQTGAHVWLPRGQPLLGSKSEASEDILKMGCQLALFNSKAKSSGSAEVDFTERRHLKARSKPGELEILRSKTRFVRIDEAFFERLKAK